MAEKDNKPTSVKLGSLKPRIKRAAKQDKIKVHKYILNVIEADLKRREL